jgi:hypothetical protein
VLVDARLGQIYADVTAASGVHRPDSWTLPDIAQRTVMKAWESAREASTLMAAWAEVSKSAPEWTRASGGMNGS